ncbi:uncharacterized protein LOC132316268 [Cornus florida]|uniref:uncharacterized protein LOC132316268 n=1 Tax=Cornus florida TaxID=4283 RepID=UPI00289A60B4|nr:uncharacterized protein LOC132316268 [Cornus florida]
MDRAEKEALRAQAREMLNSPDLTAMETLVSHLNSQDDSQKSTATKLFKFCAGEYPNNHMLKLSHLFRSCPRFDTRIRSGKLFYSLLLHPWYSYHLISPMILTEIKLAFIDCIHQEKPEPFSKITCRIVSVLAKFIFDDNKDWPELSDYAIEYVESDTEHIQELTILVFAKMPESLGKKSLAHLNRLHSTFLRRLESLNSRTRLHAISASANLVRVVPHTLYRQLEDLLPAMMQVVFEFFIEDQEMHAQKALGELVVLAMPAVEFFVPRLDYVFKSMIRIAKNGAFTEQTRCVAVKVLSALSDAWEIELIEKLPHDIIRSLFPVLMRMLTVVQDDPAWHDANNEDGMNAGKSESYDLGVYVLDQLSVALNEDIIMAIALELVPVYLAAPEWQNRFAGITALARTAQVFLEVYNLVGWLITENLNQVVTMALNLFQDPHPRVRWAAVNAITLLTKAFGPDLQVQYHQVIFPALAAATGDSQNPRVQAHAAVTMLLFCKKCTPNILTPYLAEIASILPVLLQNGNQVLQEEAWATLVSAASSQDQFQIDYDKIIPFLKAILLNATDTSKRTLRAKSMECISSIAMVVGKDKFQEDAREVIEILISLQGSLIQRDHYMQINILKTLFRLCKCLGSEIFPYSGVLMPALLQIFNQSEGIEAINILEEKALSCAVLTYCAAQLKEKFFPWIDQVIDAMIPLVNFHHTKTRLAAVSAMPALLHSAKLAVEKKQAQGHKNSYIQKLVLQVVPALVEALSKGSPETYNLWCYLMERLKLVGYYMEASIEETQTEASGSLFTKSQVKLIVNEIKRVLTARTVDNLDWVKDEEKEEIFSQSGDCLCMLIKKVKDKFSPFFDELLSYISEMLFEALNVDGIIIQAYNISNIKFGSYNPIMIILKRGNDKSAKQKQTAFCIFNDVVQQSEEAALKYGDFYLPFLLQACKDENPNVQQKYLLSLPPSPSHMLQEAARGIGVCAEFGGAKFNPSAEEAISSLNAMIGDPDALNSNNARAYDMAVSALGKICEFHHDRINAAQVFSVWLSYLPLRNDSVEAKLVHEQLCSMLEKLDNELLGPDNINLPKILDVISEVLNDSDKLLTVETAKRMVALFERYKQL